MTLEPVNQVLGKFRRAQWKQQREFGKLQQAWADIVGPVVAAQTQPSQITAQQVLLVSTSSAVWAQNLAFERQRILAKLNSLLNTPLTDIRFSTSQWQSRRPKSQTGKTWTPQSLVQGAKNSASPFKTTTNHQGEDHQEVFERWSQHVKSLAQNFPLCPQCQCATPPAELQRWSVCCLCAVRPRDSDAQSSIAESSTLANQKSDQP